MLGWTPEHGWQFSVLGAVAVIGVLLLARWRKQVRRDTLVRMSDGTYVWREWHGGKRMSAQDPSAPGGQWEKDDANDDVAAGD